MFICCLALQQSEWSIKYWQQSQHFNILEHDYLLLRYLFSMQKHSKRSEVYTYKLQQSDRVKTQKKAIDTQTNTDISR